MQHQNDAFAAEGNARDGKIPRNITFSQSSLKVKQALETLCLCTKYVELSNWSSGFRTASDLYYLNLNSNLTISDWYETQS